MKRFWLLSVLFAAILLAAFVQCSYANSVSTFYVTNATMVMYPNDDSGDNVFFTLTGPGVDIQGIGGMACFDWCSLEPIPDPNVAQTSQIFLTGFGIAIIGGTSYDPSTLSINLFNDGGGLNALATGSVGFGDPTNFTFNLVQPNAGWSLQFEPSIDASGNTVYYFTQGNFEARGITPEPSTLALMLTGFVSIVGIVKRKARTAR